MGPTTSGDIALALIVVVIPLLLLKLWYDRGIGP